MAVEASNLRFLSSSSSSLANLSCSSLANRSSFNFFNLSVAPLMNEDEDLWNRMVPGRFDAIPPIPQDGDFIYASGNLIV